MAILNYTTSISAESTIAEIQRLLAKKGAKKIVIDYDDDKQPSNVTFGVEWNGNFVVYSLPCRIDGIHNVLIRDRSIAAKFRTREQALKVGWRIIKNWIEAQLAIVDAELATLAEVFLPYAVTKDGNTLYEQLNQNNNLLLN